MMQILPHFYRLENSSLVKFLRTKITLLIKGKAKIQVQEFLIPEAMFFVLYQTEREINQTRTESTNNKKYTTCTTGNCKANCSNVIFACRCIRTL